jgi:hypothetical protein
MTLDAVVRRAVQRAPCSVRALAHAAGVSDALLFMIASGKRQATPRVALKVAHALEQWEKRCGNEAARLRAAVKGHTAKGGDE